MSENNQTSKNRISSNHFYDQFYYFYPYTKILEEKKTIRSKVLTKKWHQHQLCNKSYRSTVSICYFSIALLLCVSCIQMAHQKFILFVRSSLLFCRLFVIPDSLCSHTIMNFKISVNIGKWYIVICLNLYP